MSRKSYGVKLGVIRHRSIDTFDCPDRATANRVRRAISLMKYKHPETYAAHAREFAAYAASRLGADSWEIVLDFDPTIPLKPEWVDPR